uniref:DnaJ (Hsp40) homolog, subfamily C, member 15 n=1 Tax=Hucho hucho TaxID=62062 RepID=A0A4W5L9W0_9TELE
MFCKVGPTGNLTVQGHCSDSVGNARALTMEGETAQYAEYNPQSNIRSETEIDKRLGGTLIAVGLGVAAAGFAGRCAFQLWKRLGQVLSQTAKKMSTSAFSSHHYKGGFDQKMTKKRSHPTSTKSKVRDAHRRIMVLNHPDKGGSPYMAAKINEAKDLLDKGQQGG